MSDWIAWVDVEDRDVGVSTQSARREAGEDVIRKRLWVEHAAPYFKLTPSRARAARYESETHASFVAKQAANPETPYGIEEIPRKTGGLRSRGTA